MTVFRKAIPRRTFVRGMGATIALPLLDGMVPAFASAAETAAKQPARLGIVYFPNGMWPMDKWTPQQEGPGFELSPTLKSLAPFRDQLLVLSGLSQKEAFPAPGEGSQDHSRACGTFLTGVRVKPSEGKDFRAAISMDQIAAEKIGSEAQLRSLEVGLFSGDLVGTCETPWTCVYLSTLSWRTPTTPVPPENNPRALFERLFGNSDSTDGKERLARIHHQKSILDWVTRRASRLVNDMGPSDRAKFTEYLDAIRDVERRIQIAEKQSNRELPSFERPAGIPAAFADYAKLMFDLQVLAYQADLTRVITMMMGREGAFGSRAFPELGITDLHHTLSHHQNNAATIDQLFRINVYHMNLFSYYLDKLRSTRDGDGSLLDRTIILCGSSLSNGNIHEHVNLPLLLVGGGTNQIKGGRHIRYRDETPMTNLHLAVLDKLGVPLEKLGDSTGKLNLLSV